MSHRINLSFKEEELNLYLYIKSKRNASVYIKDLIEADMKKNNKLTDNKDDNYKNQEGLLW